MKIVLIRHGRTEWNRVERFRGRANIDLDIVGEQQTQAIAKRVAEWPISTIYVSPLRRTMHTAGILSQGLGVNTIPLSGIIDIDYGEWEGLTPDEAAERDIDLHRQWYSTPHKVRFPKGESLDDVRRRAAFAVDELIKEFPDECIALVSHKVVCQIIILHLIGLDSSHFWQIGQDVAAVNMFEVRDGVPSAILLNDTCHLGELKK